MKLTMIVTVIVLLTLGLCAVPAQSTTAKAKKADVKAAGDVSKQLIVWTSGDKEVAIKMTFMYTLNCKKYKWMDTVRLLIWGPSSKLLSEDKELQDYVKKMKEAGVELFACKACADMYGVSDKLTSLGVTVKYAGTMLANLQKQGWHVLTF